jgi:hypothetical protein
VWRVDDVGVEKLLGSKTLLGKVVEEEKTGKLKSRQPSDDLGCGHNLSGKT